MSSAVLFYVFDIVLMFVLVAVIGWRSVVVWNLTKRRTYAVIIGRDRGKGKVLRIKPNDRTFRHADGRYNIVKDPTFTFRGQRYILYTLGNPDPVDLDDRGDGRLPADVYENVIQAEVIKTLNKREGLLANMDLKKWLIVGAVAIAIIWVIQRGGLT